MTAYNRHLLAEGAYKANREAAAREERARIVALLREMADEAEADAATWHKSAAHMDLHGHHAGAEADRDEARIQKRVMQALRAAADEIEAGQ